MQNQRLAKGGHLLASQSVGGRSLAQLGHNAEVDGNGKSLGAQRISEWRGQQPDTLVLVVTGMPFKRSGSKPVEMS